MPLFWYRTNKFLAIYRQKLLILLETFQIGEYGPLANFQKWQGCRLFKGELFMENIFGGFEKRRDWGLVGFQKHPWKNLLSKKTPKGLNLSDFKIFVQIKKFMELNG